MSTTKVKPRYFPGAPKNATYGLSAANADTALAARSPATARCKLPDGSCQFVNQRSRLCGSRQSRPGGRSDPILRE